MDKAWIFEKDTFTERYLKGVDAFIQFSTANASGNDHKLFCPCRRCVNINRKSVDDVRRDIILNGFSSHYTNWVFHGEKIQPESTNPIETGYDDAHDENDDNSPMDELPELLEEVRETRNSRSSVDHDSDDFIRLMNDAKKEAYPGCQKYSVLLYVVTLLHIKVMCHWSNKSFNMLLEFLKDLLPEGNNVPSTLYGARSMLSGIGMKYEKIDACKHDCALFWKENQERNDCPVCGESRWKSTNKNGKKVPQKVLWYFPLQPRLQRLFMSSKSASNMRWHAEKRIKEDGVMRHPADSLAWKDFDAKFPDFAQDPRNVRLGFATDGFTPFGDMSNSYSIWPVILVAYNMSAFEFMKQEYFMLTLLISGPRSPGKDIDVYLRPLIDELKELWVNGIQTYDAHNGEVFQMRAAILWTVNDFPAYGNVSGWSTSGYKACPRCFDETSSIRLRDKIGFIGHRRFLPPNHPWRRKRNAFDGKVEKRLKPKEWTGSEILQRVQSLEHLFDKPGKHPNKKKRKHDPILGNWRKITIFNELPYWPFLKLPYNIDFMHVEKAVSESLAGTLFGIEGKSKDTVKAREDLRDLGIRSELHMQDDGRKPNACYTLSPADRKSFCDFLRNVKFPDGYASNISRCVKDGKIHGLKSHDYHVFLQRLVGIGVRGFLCKEVTEALVELSHFFRDLCSKTLKITDIDRLEENIPLILCKLEKIFPPAFFDVMIHLAIHLPHEARLGGPVHARWMYPFERYIRSLKQYVRNKARPEGSIAEGYISTESLTFLSKYLHGVETKFNRRVRNEDNVENESAKLLVFSLRVRPFGILPPEQKLSQKELDAAHIFILNNVPEIDHYKRMYMDELNVQELTNLHLEQFRLWLKSHINRLHDIGSQEVTSELWALANGPIPIMTRYYTSCIVNQVRFHSKDRDKLLTTQNSGLVVEGDHHGKLIDFYGFIQKVVELTFYDGYKVVLLQCEWYNTESATTCQRDKHFVSIDVRSRWYKDQPFVLPNQVEQVFYVNDTKLGPDWQIVQRVQHRHLWNLSSEDRMEEVNNQELNEVFQQDECREVMQVGEDDDLSVIDADEENLDNEEDILSEVGMDNEIEEDEDDTIANYYDSE